MEAGSNPLGHILQVNASLRKAHTSHITENAKLKLKLQ